MENLLSIKSNWKHAVLEVHIKQNDPSPNMSRSAVFEREVYAAQNVKNWAQIQMSLLDLKKEDGISISTSFQAKYSEETAEILQQVQSDIMEQLNPKRLQAQYLLQLLQANYLKKLKREKLLAKTDHMLEEEKVDMPNMARLLVEMMLTDPGCDELQLIRRLLTDWKNR